jgi:hypothetical protein
MGILKLPLFQHFFDVLAQHAKEFFRNTFEDICRCDREGVEGRIKLEERKLNWSTIYARARETIEGREPFDYPNFIRTVAEWENRAGHLFKTEQSTPHLYIAYYHAIQDGDMFCRLLHGIYELFPDIKTSVGVLKSPYRPFEKMALEKSDRSWTAHCVMDLGRGAIECPNTGEMNMVLMFLDACTSEVRRGIRLNDLAGLVEHLPEIRIVRVKNRFEHPTKGGWADILINFVFTDDLNRHVHELQIQHRELVVIRKR